MSQMFALCLAPGDLKLIEHRILFDDQGALMFDTFEDAQTYLNSNKEDFLKGYSGANIVIEEVSVQSATQEYRIFVRYCDEVPSASVRNEMEKLLESDWRARAFRFMSTPENAGAMCRAIFWAEGISFNDVALGHAIVKVQRRRPDTRSFLAKKLGPAPCEFEDIGGWDVFGINYSRAGR